MLNGFIMAPTMNDQMVYGHGYQVQVNMYFKRARPKSNVIEKKSIFPKTFLYFFFDEMKF